MIQGIAQDVYVSAPRPSKKPGGAPSYQVGVTVDGVRYGSFVMSPGAPCAKGDKVAFDAAQTPDGKYWNFDPKTFRILERGAVQVPATSNTGSVGGFNKDAAIIRQNALAHATAIVTALMPQRDAGVSNLNHRANEAAELVVQIADKFFRPYSYDGVVAGKAATVATPATQSDDASY